MPLWQDAELMLRGEQQLDQERVLVEPLLEVPRQQYGAVTAKELSLSIFEKEPTRKDLSVWIETITIWSDGSEAETFHESNRLFEAR